MFLRRSLVKPSTFPDQVEIRRVAPTILKAFRVGYAPTEGGTGSEDRRSSGASVLGLKFSSRRCLAGGE
jgi:hypothetical protein